MEFEWNIFPGHNTLQLSQEVKSLLLRLDETQENFKGRIIFMSTKNAKQMLKSFLSMQRDLEQDNGHFLVLVQRKSGFLSVKIVHKVNGTKWRTR